jgi:hypothetical protein
VKRFLTLILALAATLLALPSAVQANHSFGFTWIDPVEREDGTPLEPGELGGYRLQCSSPQETAETVAAFDVTTLVGGKRTFLWENAVQRGGWYDCRMTAIDTSQLESEWSVTIRIRKLARPKAPTIELEQTTGIAPAQR